MYTKHSLYGSFIILLLFVGSLNAQKFDESDTFENAETFESGLPSTWTVSGGGSMEITSKRNKQGQHALLWKWENQSTLSTTDSRLRNASDGSNAGMHIWLYSEQELQDSIQFVFYDNYSRERCAFYYKLNFIGWRGLWVRFWDDIAIGSYAPPLTRMEIRAPGSTPSGEVFIDIVEFKSSVSYKRSPSYQYVHPYPYGKNQEVKDEWEALIYQNRYPSPSFPLPTEVSSELQQEMASLSNRYESWILGSGNFSDDPSMLIRKQARSRFIDNGVQLFNQLPVSKSVEGIITGPALFTNKSSHKPNFGRDIGEKLCLQLAMDYRLNGNTGSRDKLLLLYDYMHDQGWAEGSAMETLDHQKLRTAGWVHSVFLMKDVLKQIPWRDGLTLLDREMATLKWLCGFHVIFAPLHETIAVSVDDFRSTTLFRLLYILMMENDNPVKVQYMNHYTQWINRNLRTYEGWTGGIKPDGMGYHHRGPYMNAYSNNGIHTMTQILYFLRHTSFDTDTEAKETLKKYILNYRLATLHYDVPKGVSGRISGLEKATSMMAPMAYLAQSMLPDQLDTELVAAMKRLWHPGHDPVADMINKHSMSITLFNTLGELESILTVANHTTVAESNPTGFWVKPYAAMAIFKGDDWSVSVKGTSAYVWNFESGSSENTYGRYDSNGQMEITNNTGSYPSMVKSGHDYNKGWNWNRIPGTTSVNETLSALQNSEQRVFSPNTFVGGVHLANTSGVWAMEHDDVHYRTNLHFKKSIFFFEPGLMVCLGSDITSSYRSRTESTLLQNIVSSSGYTFSVNGQQLGSSDYTYSPRNSYATILDNEGKGLFIRDDTHLNMALSEQESETMRRKQSSGRALTAWFSHAGNNSYEYAILMKTSNEELASLATQPMYEVIRQDDKAHIVKHPSTQQTGYALFSSEVSLNDDLIQKVTKPVMIMAKEHAQKKYSISICNPDFNRSKLNSIGDIDTFDELFGPFAAQSVQVTLKNAWSIEPLADNMRIVSKTKKQTVLEILTHDAENYEFTLNPDTSTTLDPGEEDEILAWPNPVKETIFFNNSEDVKLYDMQGQLMAQVQNTASLNLSNVPAGPYILELNTPRNIHRVKIIKTNNY